MSLRGGSRGHGRGQHPPFDKLWHGGGELEQIHPVHHRRAAAEVLRVGWSNESTTKKESEKQHSS